MASSSPTQRSLAKWREAGAIAQVVERWNPHAKIRVDLFGVIDIVAFTATNIVGIQATSASNASARVEKALAEVRLAGWLQAGGVFFIDAWGKRGARGKRKLWLCRSIQVVLLGGGVMKAVDLTEVPLAEMPRHA